MAKQTGAPLSATFVRTITKPGRYGDGRGGFGLSILVKPMANGRTSRTWCQRLRINGKEFNIGLGSYPIVTLAKAREKALANRQLIEDGGDPRTGQAGGTVPTFAEAAEKVIALKRFKAGSAVPGQWRQSFRDYAFPVIGEKLVSGITPADVLAVLEPIWTAKPSTGKKVRQRIGAVMKWAMAKEYRTDNPAGDAITEALPQNGGGHTHHAAIPHRDVAAALAKVRNRGADIRSLALEFLILTACRASEVAGARWSEVEGDTWTIPANRIKAKREHRVPLSRQARAVLEAAKALAGGSGLIFPSRTGKPNRKAFRQAMNAARVTTGTPHGFRSSFRDWCAETGVVREVAERALSHVTKNKVEAAYFRTDLLEQRREVMQGWADYTDAS